MKYEKLLIQWTMHSHVTSEIRRLECLTFIYIHDLLRFFYENSFTFPTIKFFLLPCKAMSYWMKYEKLLLTFCNPIICYWISVILQKKMANCFIRLRLKFSQEYYNDTFITIHDAVWIVCMLYDVGYIFLLVFPTGSYGITLVIDRLNAACLPCLVLCYLF